MGNGSTKSKESFIAIAYLISSQRQAQEYLSVFLLVGTGL